MKNLGSFYWNEKIGVGNLKANDFDFPESLPKNVNVVSASSLCDCGNYGQRVLFKVDNDLYSFNFLSGYPCQCGDRV